MNIIGHKKIFLTFSGIIILVSTLSVLIWGLKLGIDYTGGSLLEVEFSLIRPAPEAIRSALGPLGLENAVIQPAGERGFILRFQNIDETGHQRILAVLKGLNPVGQVNERRFDAIGPTIGAELKKNSIIAICLAIVGIVFYIAWAFRKVSKPIASWKYGIATIFALVHDVIIPTGMFALLGHLYGIEVDTLFITALLTILGFSVHDTIVVFDRIRENLRKLKNPEPFEITVNRSMNETLARSINTSLTVLIVLSAIWFFGGETTRHFALALIVGIIFGTYSSIFVASPVLVIWNQWTKKG